MIETIVITESYGRQSCYNPSAAMKIAKASKGTTTIFFRNKNMKIEYRVIFIDGKISGMRVKLGHKLCLSDEIYDDIPNWDEFIDSLGL